MHTFSGVRQASKELPGFRASRGPIVPLMGALAQRFFTAIVNDALPLSRESLRVAQGEPVRKQIAVCTFPTAR